MTSRFNLVQAPPREPGHCWITKTSVGPFIDTGIDLSVKVIDRGRIYISVDALREMAQVAGLFEEDEPKEVGLRKKRWYEEGYNDAMKEISNGHIDRFIEHIVSSTTSAAGGAAVVAPAGHHSTAGAAVSNPEDATAGAQQVDENVDGSEQQGAESIVLEGSASLSTNPGDDGNFRL